MKNINRYLKLGALSLALLTSGSVLAEQAFTNKQAPGKDGIPNQLISAVAWKQTAAEYRALYHQGFNIARMRLDQALATHKKGDKPLAVVTDMDDTILLANSYWGHLINQNKDFFDDAIWDQWIPKNKMMPSPGSLEFLNYAKSKGVEVFYVTSREQGEPTYQYALDHLKVYGFPYADPQHLTVLRDTSNKEKPQQEIAQKFNIVVMLGDNLNDFKRLYYVKDVDKRIELMEQDKDLFGQKFIIFPNPTDGHWVAAIFGDSEPPANDQNRLLFKKAATKESWDGK